MKNIPLYLLLLTVISVSSSCSDFLNEKPDKNLVNPSTLEDFQALLDNSPIMNTGTGHLLGEISGDNLEVDKDTWSRLTSAYEKNAYIWAKDIFSGASSTDWNNPAMVILYCNLALEGTNKVSREINPALWDNVRGSALFFRANAFFQLLQLFGNPYHPQTAATDLGIPLRLESDISVKSKRSTVEECYNKITADLTSAAQLLPQNAIRKTRPSRAAAHALLARNYLTMGKYELAAKNAEYALTDYSTLIDFNSVDSTLASPFSNRDEEIVFFATTLSPQILTPNFMSVAHELYSEYDSTDLRRTRFFTVLNGKPKYKGAYFSTLAFFTGISTGEIWITLAEAKVRIGEVENAKIALQKLLSTRYEKGIPPKIPSEDEKLLALILEHRRKELTFKGLRWTDLRRLNIESKFAKTLTRNWNTELFSLEPGSPLYVFPIPDEVIRTTEMLQNIR
jgi:tetratricopeptide (TPR) repeat protein